MLLWVVGGPCGKEQTFPMNGVNKKLGLEAIARHLSAVGTLPSVLSSWTRWSGGVGIGAWLVRLVDFSVRSLDGIGVVPCTCGV